MQMNYYFQSVCVLNTFDFQYAYGQRGGDQLCVVSVNIAADGPETRLTCMPCQTLNFIMCVFVFQRLSLLSEGLHCHGEEVEDCPP